MIRKYCKAYYLKSLRQFSEWSENTEEDAPALSDEDVVYLWDDFTVVRSPVLPGGIIFDRVTSQWQEFCRSTLEFSIPEDLRYAYEENKVEENTTEKAVVESSNASH